MHYGVMEKASLSRGVVMLVRGQIEADNQEGDYCCRLKMPGGSQIGLDIIMCRDQGGMHIKRLRFVHAHPQCQNVPVYGLQRVPEEVREIFKGIEFPDPNAYNTMRRVAFVAEVDSPTAIEALQRAAIKSSYLM